LSEKILKALARLFAIIARSDQSAANSREVVEEFLGKQLNKAQVAQYLSYYDECLREEEGTGDSERKKRRIAVNSVKVVVICNQINEELTQKQKFIVLVNLLEFISSKAEISTLEMEFVETVASSFFIPDEEFRSIRTFIVSKSIPEINSIPDLLVVSDKQPALTEVTKWLRSESITEPVYVLRIPSVNMYLVGAVTATDLLINGQAAVSHKVYLFPPGGSVKNNKGGNIYYSDIVGRFLSEKGQTPVRYVAENIEYEFRSGKKGLHAVSIHENSGKMIGIMGGSGAGKSTLLNVLNGNYKPTAGRVTINGIDIHSEKKKLEGVIGYVPQDDLLISELTVYQNLFYNSKLCLEGFSDKEIGERVDKLLDSIGLLEAKDLKVGDAFNKTISGGQRKRLNIALELIREPSVLFCDEPTSGLSSRDSENIMDLLKELGLKGKLIFVVIHQPSSDIFKMFDKLLLLDNGGYPVYYGNPVDSLNWFKRIVNHANPAGSECEHCGNVNPEQIFNILEAKVLNEDGNLTNIRRVTPQEWNEHFKSAQQDTPPVEAYKENVLRFRKPGLIKQFKVFMTRDLLSKLSDRQYLAINLLEAPVLGFILAYLVKFYRNGNEYVFYENRNLTAYIFMSVIVALFIGLTVSAEEIFRDRKILKRESFLNLSRGSYLLSKISILFLVSAIQTATFVFIGNSILEIDIFEMYGSYWMVLFSIACFANMLGLNISSAFRSAVTIYIMIPFLIIPQLLLSGVLVKFEELHPFLSSRKTVPWAGDLMASRWAFEALAVKQFRDNEYEKLFFEQEKMISETTFRKVYWASKMMSVAEDLVTNKRKSPEDFREEISLLLSEVKKSIDLTGVSAFKGMMLLEKGQINDGVVEELRMFIGEVKRYYAKKEDAAITKKDEIISTYDPLSLLLLRSRHHNRSLEDFVRNKSLEDEVAIEEGEIISTSDPVFREGGLRSHFFSSGKKVLGKVFDTYCVNMAVIWSMTLVMAIALYFDWLRKIMEMFGKKA